MLAVDFQHLILPGKPNYYLVCPAHYCNVGPQQDSPIYPIPMQGLILGWNAMVARQPRVELLAQNPTLNQYDYVQRSRWFHFPDYITVRFIALTGHTSTLAIYSRAKYGYYDFKVNQKRVQKWLADLLRMTKRME